MRNTFNKNIHEVIGPDATTYCFLYNNMEDTRSYDLYEYDSGNFCHRILMRNIIQELINMFQHLK